MYDHSLKMFVLPHVRQGNDYIEGGGGRDDIVGGHNLRRIGTGFDGLHTGYDGNDTMKGGDGCDAILGDNGEIIRHRQSISSDHPWINGMVWREYPAPFNAEVIREIRRHDDIDNIQGDDFIYGEEGNDILHGQRGNDYISGGGGEDEIYGELGEDILLGDAGNDVVIGDIGYAVRRYDSTGMPVQQDTNSGTSSPNVWHKDIILEELGNITGVDRISTKVNLDLLTADKIMQSSLLFVATAYQNDGSKHINKDEGGWLTKLLRFQLVESFNDEINGGDGDDILIGQRGDDIIRGDDGNDLIIGDAGWNSLPMETNFPRIYQIYRVLADRSNSEIDVGCAQKFGVTFTANYEVYPSQYQEVGMMRSSFVDMAITADDVVGDTNNLLRERLGVSALNTRNGYWLQPMLRITPGFLQDTQWMHGNDVIEPGPGDNIVAGDDIRGFVGLDVKDNLHLNTVRKDINNMILALETRLSTMEVDLEFLNNRPTTEYEIRVGNDKISTERIPNSPYASLITGDTLTIIGRTISSGWLMKGLLLVSPKKFKTVLQRLMDIQQVLANVHYCMFEIHTRLLEKMESATGDHKADQVPLHHLFLANDEIDSNGQNDVVVGDSALLYIHIDRTGVNFELDTLKWWKRFRMNCALRRDRRKRERNIKADIKKYLQKTSDLDRLRVLQMPYTDLPFKLTAASDQISMNLEDNLAVGDFASIGVVLSTRSVQSDRKKMEVFTTSVQSVHTEMNLQTKKYETNPSANIPYPMSFYHERYSANKRDLVNPHIHGDHFDGQHSANIALGEYLSGFMYQTRSDRSSLQMGGSYDDGFRLPRFFTNQYDGDTFTWPVNAEVDGQIGRDGKDVVNGGKLSITTNVWESVQNKMKKLFSDHDLIVQLSTDLWLDGYTLTKSKARGFEMSYEGMNAQLASYIPCYSDRSVVAAAYRPAAVVQANLVQGGNNNNINSSSTTNNNNNVNADAMGGLAGNNDNDTFTSTTADNATTRSSIPIHNAAAAAVDNGHQNQNNNSTVTLSASVTTVNETTEGDDDHHELVVPMAHCHLEHGKKLCN